MANVSGYTFNNMGRIGLDDCNKSQTDIQNVASCNYSTQNFFAADCSMKNPINLATMTPLCFHPILPSYIHIPRHLLLL